MLAFLLCRNDSLQVYTLAMQVRGVERQLRSRFHHHCHCHHLQTGHGACKETKGRKNRGDRGRGNNIKAEVAFGMTEHVWKSCMGPDRKPVSQPTSHLLQTNQKLMPVHFIYHSGPKLSVWVSAILPWSSTNMKRRKGIITTSHSIYHYTLVWLLYEKINISINTL